MVLIGTYIIIIYYGDQIMSVNSGQPDASPSCYDLLYV